MRHALVAGRSAVTTCLVQEPGPAFSFVDPDLEQAGGGNVAMLFADIVDFTQARRQVLVVVAQFGKHIQRVDIIRVIVQHALQARDMPDRTKGSSADLADALGDGIRHGEKLVALLIEHEVIVAEVRTADMPVEVLRLQIECENVCENGIERAADIAGRVG